MLLPVVAGASMFAKKKTNIFLSVDLAWVCLILVLGREAQLIPLTWLVNPRENHHWISNCFTQGWADSLWSSYTESFIREGSIHSSIMESSGLRDNSHSHLSEAAMHRCLSSFRGYILLSADPSWHAEPHTGPVGRPEPAHKSAFLSTLSTHQTQGKVGTHEKSLFSSRWFRN